MPGSPPIRGGPPRVRRCGCSRPSARPCSRSPAPRRGSRRGIARRRAGAADPAGGACRIASCSAARCARARPRARRPRRGDRGAPQRGSGANHGHRDRTGTVTGLDGLAVRVALDGTSLPPARACGAGCDASAGAPSASARRVAVHLSGRDARPRRCASPCRSTGPSRRHRCCGGPSGRFPSCAAWCTSERLSADGLRPLGGGGAPKSPDRPSYRSDSGNAGVIRRPPPLGSRGRRRVEARHPEPTGGRAGAALGAGAYDVALLGGGRIWGGRDVVRFSMFEPTTPAGNTVTLDRATLRPVTVQMTAAAHFMRDRYVAFNAPRRIRPPVAP